LPTALTLRAEGHACSDSGLAPDEKDGTGRDDKTPVRHRTAPLNGAGCEANACDDRPGAGPKTDKAPLRHSNAPVGGGEGSAPKAGCGWLAEARPALEKAPLRHSTAETVEAAGAADKSADDKSADDKTADDREPDRQNPISCRGWRAEASPAPERAPLRHTTAETVGAAGAADKSADDKSADDETADDKEPGRQSTAL